MATYDSIVERRIQQAASLLQAGFLTEEAAIKLVEKVRRDLDLPPFDSPKGPGTWESYCDGLGDPGDK